MIRIDTPPMLQGKDDGENIKSLRQYLYRELDSLQTQLNMIQDENDVAIAAAAKSGGSATSTVSGIKEAPKDGNIYGRKDGAWAEIDEAAEGMTLVGTGKTVTFDLNGASAVLVQVTFSKRPYSAVIPVSWMTEEAKTWAIAVYQNNILVSAVNDNGSCTISHSSYTLTVYTLGAVGGSGGGSSGDGHSHDNKDTLDGISDSDISNWDSAYSHVSDSTVHVTADNKQSWNSAALHAADNRPHVLLLTEDMVTVVRTATKGVAPYNTSYYYTDITVNDMTDDDLAEGMLVMPVVASTMVVNSSYLNVRIRFGSSGSWHPVMGTTSILAGSSYFTSTQYRLYQYRTNTRSEGAFHVLTDSNSTYSAYSLGIGYGTCSSATATTTKVASLASYSLHNGGICAIKFDNAVPADSTLNINSKGAKPIYHRGAVIAADAIKAGDVATFVYTTTVASGAYVLLTVDRDEKGSGGTSSTAWSDITGKPDSFTPSAHQHTVADIGDMPRIPTDTGDLTNGAGYVTSAYHDSSKQDTIADLDAIRSGAAAGATALQSYAETDPTVPSWAKQTNKPSYTAAEVGAAASNHTHSYSSLDDLPTIPAAYDDTALAGRVSTIEGKESGWDAKFDLPSGGSAGQVLKKTASGTEWANESGGGGSFSGITNKGSASVKTGTNLTFSISSGDTAILLLASFGSRLYSEMIPIDMLSDTAKTFAIAVYNNYVEVKISLSGSTVTVSRSSTTAHTIYAYTL